jgi:hypothetical protein
LALWKAQEIVFPGRVGLRFDEPGATAYALVSLHVDLVSAYMNEISFATKADIICALLTGNVEFCAPSQATDVGNGFVIAVAVGFGNAGNLARHDSSHPCLGTA